MAEQQQQQGGSASHAVPVAPADLQQSEPSLSLHASPDSDAAADAATTTLPSASRAYAGDFTSANEPDADPPETHANHPKRLASVLLSGKWLSSTVVDDTSALFRARSTRVGLPAEVADLQSTDRSNQPFTPVKADGVQPICFESHWWLVVWSKARGLIRVLHSLPSCETVATRAAVRGFVRELLGEYMTDQVAALDTAVDLFAVPQEQTGSDDCGAFVLWMLRAYELGDVDLLQESCVLSINQGTLRGELAASVTALAHPASAAVGMPDVRRTCSRYSGGSTVKSEEAAGVIRTEERKK